jgi:hypothetical protein
VCLQVAAGRTDPSEDVAPGGGVAGGGAHTVLSRCIATPSRETESAEQGS